MQHPTPPSFWAALWRWAQRPEIAAWALAVFMTTVVWLPVGLPMLRGVDAAVYCQVAREMSLRPLAAWATFTLDGAPFYEHPPALMVALALWFSVFGATTQAALWASQAMMTLLTALCACVGLWIAGPYGALGTLLGLCLQSGFWQEAHNPMLELPTNLALTLGAWGLLLEGRAQGAWGRRAGAAAAILGPALALLTKGPVGALSLPIGAALAASGLCCWQAAWRRCLTGVGLAAVLLAVWEARRCSTGQESFVMHYWAQQLWPSMVQGRHNPVASYGYYIPVLRRWYGVGLALLPLAWWATGRPERPPHTPSARKLTLFATVWLMFVVIGFSCMRQKYQWYMHIALPAFGWLGGAALSGLATRARQHVCRLVVSLALVTGAAWLAVRAIAPERLAPREPACLAGLHRLAPLRPLQQGGHPTLACCVGAAGWRERYVALFVHGALLVPCGQNPDFQLGEKGWFRP